MPKYGIKVAEVMTRNPVKIMLDEGIINAAKLMSKHSVGTLAVVDAENRIRGILSEADIVRKIVANGLGLELKVRDVMTKRPVCVKPDDDIGDVVRKIVKYGHKVFPVQQDGKLVGYITYKDILAVQPGIVDVLQEALLNDLREMRLKLKLIRRMR